MGLGSVFKTQFRFINVHIFINIFKYVRTESLIFVKLFQVRPMYSQWEIKLKVSNSSTVSRFFLLRCLSTLQDNCSGCFKLWTLCISQFQMRPAPPPRTDPREFAFFFLWMANSRGRGHLSCQMPGGRDESRRQMPPIHNESNATDCETRQFMHAQSFRSCYIRVRDLIK